MQDPFRHLMDERFGMFIHYGIYSALGGSYHGEKIKGLGEWIQRHARIPIAEYEKIGREQFCPAPDFAKKIVKSAKAAGIRYIVLTSKHHDGFCLFKTNASSYNTYDFFGRDLCRELADACREEGLEVGFYYSHTLDWYEKDAGGSHYAATWADAHNRNDWDFPDENINFEKYLQEKCFPQVRELLENYGPLKIIWFDFPHDITYEQSAALRALVKSIQPDCQINSRIAHGLCDYYSLGDNGLPTAPRGVNTECLITLNHTWGFRFDDDQWKTPADTIGILSRCLTSDATLLLNVGPRADGSLTPETEHILAEMGKWTSRNADAVYGRITGNPFSSLFSWGRVAVKENKLFLYVTDTAAESLSISGIEGKVASVSLLGSDEKIGYSFENGRLTVSAVKTDMTVPVYAVTFEEVPVFSREIMQNGNDISLGIFWASKVKRGCEDGELEKLRYEIDHYRKDYGTHGLAIQHTDNAHKWSSAEEIMAWDVYVTEPGTYEAEVIHAPYNVYQSEVYNLPTPTKGTFTLSANGVKNAVEVEESSRYRISLTGGDNIRIVHRAGTFTFNQVGKQRILLARTEDGESLPVTDVKLRKI